MNTCLYRYNHVDVYETSIIATVVAYCPRRHMSRRMGSNREDSPDGEQRGGVVRGMRRFRAATSTILRDERRLSEKPIDARRYCRYPIFI